MNIELEIDDEDVPLNRFVRKVLKNVLEGIVKELDGVSEDMEKIEIKLEK